ncbi:MAG: WD40/YVTN/BNR-like repeat-containing protein [Halobacteriota archaeon]
MDLIHVAMPSALLTVRPEGSIVRSLVDRRLECVAVDPDRPARIVVGTFDDGLHRSIDGGESFERVGRESIAPDAITALAIAPDDPDVIWAGTEPSRVYRSTDGGQTWVEREGLGALDSAAEWSFPPRPHTHHVRWIEPDPAAPDHLYVGIEAGALVQTRDGGQTWIDRVPTARIDVHSIATHPATPDRAWTAAGDGYAETTDGGETWSYPQPGLDRRYCWSLAVDAEDPRTVLLSAAEGARSAHAPDRAEAYVYRKRGEEAWERLDGTGLPMGRGVVRAVLGRAAAGGRFYAATNRGVFATADAGDSWAPIADEWPAHFETRTPRGLAVVPVRS